MEVVFFPFSFAIIDGAYGTVCHGVGAFVVVVFESCGVMSVRASELGSGVRPRS